MHIRDRGCATALGLVALVTMTGCASGSTDAAQTPPSWDPDYCIHPEGILEATASWRDSGERAIRVDIRTRAGATVPWLGETRLENGTHPNLYQPLVIDSTEVSTEEARAEVTMNLPPPTNGTLLLGNVPCDDGERGFVVLWLSTEPGKPPLAVLSGDMAAR